jgi:AraC family transcriptional regulator, regulatory protein of adaptative response / methylated-DNA-[protein]-cysteine methyltransferase
MSCKLIQVDRKENLQLSYGYSESPFGGCFIAWSDRGICFLAFGDEKISDQAIANIKAHWPNSNLIENKTQAGANVSRVFTSNDHNLIISGTDFQIKVWNELLNIQAGIRISYETLASKLGGTNYTRACASAVARNNISYLIPCHRIISKSGDINKYRWGVEYKKKLLDYEKNS